jgi:dihydroorotase
MRQQLTIRQPDDWHIHLRDEPYLKDTVRDASSNFGRALVMPNLTPPVINVADAINYRGRILKYSTSKSFTPLMTLYLTPQTTVTDIEQATETDFIKGVKWYPKHGTTGSSHSIEDISKCSHILQAMSDLDLPLLIHGELTQYNLFERERCFIEQVMAPLVEKFPQLRMVIEHVSTKEAVDFVYARDNIAATITPQHLAYDFTSMLGSTMQPHYFCMPVLKTPQDKAAIARAAVSGDKRFFAGTDSAPHPRAAKESAHVAAGCYSAYHSLALYAQVFDELGKMDMLEDFTSRFGANFYNEPLNTSQVTLVKQAWTVPETLPLGDAVVVPLAAGKQLDWQVV